MTLKHRQGLKNFNRIFVLNQAGLDHPRTNSAVPHKRSGHTRLCNGLNIAARWPGPIVFQNRLPNLKLLTTQAFQLNTPCDQITSVLAIVHPDTGGLLEVFQILSRDQRYLTFINAGPVTCSAAVSITLQTTASQSFDLPDFLHLYASLWSNIDFFNFALHENELFDWSGARPYSSCKRSSKGPGLEGAPSAGLFWGTNALSV